MLNTLLETKPVRTKRMGGTVMSTLLHAAIVAGAIALTRPLPVTATVAPPDDIFTFHPPAAPPDRSRGPASAPPRNPTSQPDFNPVHSIDPTIPVITGPVIDAQPTVIDRDDDFGLSHGKGSIDDTGDGLSAPSDGIIDEHLVDRAPRIVGRAPEPEFPSSLRQSGTNGRVVVQFAVDTLGRAEMGGLKMIEESDPRFGAAVRDVLPRYRFSPGEVRGRKVRTLVQIPFDFTLVR